ncbi:MAG: Regulatory protein ArsR [Candidatus Thorarchaeota archaeon]|nr:MAG: Regulatory protein ArsR [Candidatus Thorarchaeota archaeon]
MKRILWWLIAGTRGGVNRARIIMTLNERPYNANQLTELLDLDYKTIRHHLEVLMDNGVIVSQGNGYGTLYFLTRDMEASYEQFESIWNQVRAST